MLASVSMLDSLVQLGWIVNHCDSIYSSSHSHSRRPSNLQMYRSMNALDAENIDAKPAFFGDECYGNS
jgi:hypothetical protein